MTTQMSARIIERLLGSPEATTIATELAAEDVAARQALVDSIVEHQRLFDLDGPPLVAEIEQAKARIPAARKALREALQAVAFAQRAREHTLNAHLEAVEIEQAQLVRKTPPFLNVAIRNATLALREVDRFDDATPERAIRREALRWTLSAFAELQQVADPTPADVDAIERQAPAVGQLRMGIAKVRELHQSAIRYGYSEVRGLDRFAADCRATLAALNALDPHAPSLASEVEKLRAKLRSSTPAMLRGETW